MKAASFAPLLEEEIPTSFSPGCVDNADNTEQAGRTPHIRRLEAERNINLLKNSLHMSGLKINAALYDSPMSIVSTGSENTHPNKLPSTGKMILLWKAHRTFIKLTILYFLQVQTVVPRRDFL